MKRATEAVESVIGVTAPLAKSIETLNQRQESMARDATEWQGAIHSRIAQDEQDIAVVGDRLTNISRSFWSRLRWLMTGKAV